MYKNIKSAVHSAEMEIGLPNPNDRLVCISTDFLFTTNIVGSCKSTSIVEE
jgi:hypothetical protein